MVQGPKFYTISGPYRREAAHCGVERGSMVPVGDEVGQLA